MCKLNLLRILTAAFFALTAVSLLSQTTSDGSMPQYYFEDFSEAKVKMKNGQIQTPLLNYNTVTGKMVFTKDGQYYDISNPGMIDTVCILNIKFVPVGKAFYEVLITGATSLFVQYKGDLLPAGKPSGYGGTSQLSSSTYLTSVELSGGRYNLSIPSDFIVKIKPLYWIRKGDEFSDFYTEKQFLNLYPDKAVQMKEFIRKNRIKTDRKEDVIKLVNYFISLDN